MNREISIIISALILVLSFVVIAFVVIDSSSDGLGWMGGHMSHDDGGLTNTGLFVLISMAVIAAISLIALFFLLLSGRRENKGIDSFSRRPSSPLKIIDDTVRSPIIDTQVSETPIIQKPTEADPGPSIKQQEEEKVAMISRLLEGDERRLYEFLASAEGEVLQKDIVARKLFSKPKVTRLLDRLEQKGLITKERYGATNKIKLVR